jgi:hypothetical protein
MQGSSRAEAVLAALLCLWRPRYGTQDSTRGRKRCMLRAPPTAGWSATVAPLAESSAGRWFGPAARRPLSATHLWKVAKQLGPGRLAAAVGREVHGVCCFGGEMSTMPLDLCMRAVPKGCPNSAIP